MTIRSFSIAIAASTLACLCSCGNGNTAQQGNDSTATTDTATHMMRDAGRTRPQAGKGDSLAGVRQMIVGTWTDETDPKSELIFTPDKQISLYDGKDADTVDYDISNVNCANGIKEQEGGGVYLKTDQCYAIMHIDRHTLNLTYYERGNSLVYKRKQ